METINNSRVPQNRRFNVRVYGLFVHLDWGVLLSHEEMNGYRFTKFPGGGLEWGEGLVDGLRREIREELGLELPSLEHYYTTDFFQTSAFRPDDQVISVYYKVGIPAGLQRPDFSHENVESEHKKQWFRWCGWDELTPESCTFPIDREIVSQLLSTRRH